MDADSERNRREIIKKQADEIRAKLERGMYLGLPIDLNDPDMLIASVWFLCQSGKPMWEQKTEAPHNYYGECPYCHEMHDLRLACHSYAQTQRYPGRP